MTPHDLRRAREALGLTQAELALLLETDAQSVSRMEMTADKSTSRPLAPRMARLILAYIDGWRPEDWPQPRHLRRRAAINAAKDERAS